jgi:hypothetical protein
MKVTITEEQTIHQGGTSMNTPAIPVALEIPAVPGTPFAGGFYMGRIFVGVNTYAIVVAPKAEGDHEETPWNESTKNVAGALSYFDGVTNTKAMAEAGSKLAKWAQELRIGGFDDWHIPSRQELLTIKGNEADAGDAFQEAGAEAFVRDWYWSSTQSASDESYAWIQFFDFGYQSTSHKDDYYRARAVRRVAI